MKTFASRVEIINPSGGHVRYVPGTLAAAMVAAGSAEIANMNGKVKSVRLIATAANCARRIGEPSPWNMGGIRYVRRERLDESGSIIWTFHPRSLDK